VNTRNITKRRSPLVATLSTLLLFATACGGNDPATSPTSASNAASAKRNQATPATTPTDGEVPAGNKPTGTAPSGGVIITTPPTIFYDDSAAAEFWDPVPQGMDPAEFSPKYLTREEVTKYAALPNPNPEDWDIPASGPTPEYAARVYAYIQALRSGLSKVASEIGPDDPRVRESAVAPFSGGSIDLFLKKLDEDASADALAYGEWTTMTDLRVLQVDYRTVTDEHYPCMFIRVTFTSVRESHTEDRDLWVTLIRNGPPNWLNPSGWREEMVAPNDWPDLADVSCDSWDNR